MDGGAARVFRMGVPGAGSGDPEPRHDMSHMQQYVSYFLWNPDVNQTHGSNYNT